MNTKPLLPGEPKIRVLQSSGHTIFFLTNQYITWFYVPFYFKTPYLIYSGKYKKDLQKYRAPNYTSYLEDEI